jgi:hypothetical protein
MVKSASKFQNVILSKPIARSRNAQNDSTLGIPILLNDVVRRRIGQCGFTWRALSIAILNSTYQHYKYEIDYPHLLAPIWKRGVISRAWNLRGVADANGIGDNSPSFAIVGHFSIHDICHVAAFAEKLHNFFASACHLRPT